MVQQRVFTTIIVFSGVFSVLMYFFGLYFMVWVMIKGYRWGGFNVGLNGLG